MLIPSSIASKDHAMQNFPLLATVNVTMIIATLTTVLASDRLLRLAAAAILP